MAVKQKSYAKKLEAGLKAGKSFSQAHEDALKESTTKKAAPKKVAVKKAAPKKVAAKKAAPKKATAAKRKKYDEEALTKKVGRHLKMIYYGKKYHKKTSKKK